MEPTGSDLVRRFFALIGAGDIEAALELTTEDVILDRSASNAPWRGFSRGRAEMRVAYSEFESAWAELGGVSWEGREIHPVGPRLAIETRIRGRGPGSGLAMDASGAWLVSLEGNRISAGVLYQSVAEALLGGRRRALAEARLYFVCEGLPHGRDPGPLLDAALQGGAEAIQLRHKAPRCAEEVVALAEPFRRAATEHGALFILNDFAELVEPCGADGVHVGQEDAGVAEARRLAGGGAVVGLSTHTAEQLDAARSATGADRPDQLSVGPVWETPTKQGRPASGLGLVEHAAAGGGDPPWFAIGGIDRANVAEVVAAGAERIVVVRAIRDADDPEAAARELRAALAAAEAE